MLSIGTNVWINFNWTVFEFEQSTYITLTETRSVYSIIASIVDCNTVGKEEDSCFKPNISFSSDVRYLKFNIQVIIAGRNSTIYKSDLTLICYKPGISRLFPTTAMSGQTVTLYVH